MAKTEVYSWRLTPEKKQALEHEARREGKGLAALLDMISSDWLASRRAAAATDEAEQARLHEAAARCLGAIAGSDPDRSKNVRSQVRRRLRERRGR